MENKEKTLAQLDAARLKVKQYENKIQLLENRKQHLEKKADRTPEEEDMLDMMLHGGERVRIQNLQGVISWYNGKR